MPLKNSMVDEKKWNARFPLAIHRTKTGCHVPPTILVVEYNFDLAESIKNVLIEHDYPCIAIRYGSLESMLPKLNSISLVICGAELLFATEQFLRQLQSIVSTHSASVIYTTGVRVPDEVPDIQILQKPFSVEALLNKVQRHLAAVAAYRQNDNARHVMATLSAYKQSIPS